ncbi:ribosome biogenesis factor YjgA [Nitrosomonas communis]|uniref:ribosome biogenesis factor YjgA n=1 Tax=Nitrosomonas communis TaxID=44574 RepID=UPI003D28238B
MQNNIKHDADQESPLSKTRRKRAMHALQDIGEQLVTLDLQQIAELDLPEILKDALFEAKRITKHEAHRRQLQYIGKLMRKIDVAPIQEKINSVRSTSIHHTAWLHLLERWRERLLADEAAFTEFGQQYPNADLQRLRILVRNTIKEKLAGKPPKNFRALFQELRSIIPEKTPSN